MDTFRVALSLVGIVLVIFAAYYATWFISVKASGQSRSKLKNKNINLIDRFAFSKDKSFCLVEIAGKVYIIGVTNQSMTLIDTLDSEVFAETKTERRETAAWQMAGGGFTTRLTKKLAAFMAHRMGRQPETIKDGGGAMFADSMRNARGDNESGQPDRVQSEQTYDPEEEE